MDISHNLFLPKSQTNNRYMIPVRNEGLIAGLLAEIVAIVSIDSNCTEEVSLI